MMNSSNVKHYKVLKTHNPDFRKVVVYYDGLYGDPIYNFIIHVSDVHKYLKGYQKAGYVADHIDI